MNDSFVLLDTYDDDADLARVSRNLLKEMFPTFDVERMSFVQEDSWRNGEQVFALGDDDRQFKVVIKNLRKCHEVQAMKKFKFDGEIYVSCDVPEMPKLFEWDVHHQDTYPHRSRSSLRYKLGQDYTSHTAFYSGDLPNGIDVEKLDIIGLQTEIKLKKNSKKLLQADTIGIFDASDFDRHVSNFKNLPGRDTLWLKVNPLLK